MRKKVVDEKAIRLIKQVLDNFESKIKGKGMPLGNYTSQFFANVYLNELDYFVKHILKAKYYIRYVDDFVILHRNKKRLAYFRREIENFLVHNLKIWLHPNKTKIVALRNGIIFLGYRIFFYYKLLLERNIRLAKRKILMLKNDELTKDKFAEFFQGWNAYAKWANTFELRKNLLVEINKF